MAAAVKNMTSPVSAQAGTHAPTVSASYVRALIDFAANHGADRLALQSRAAIEPPALLDPDARVPFAKVRTLMLAAKDLCGDPAFALHFGADPRLYETTIVGLIIRSAETMGEAFAQFSRLARLVMEVDLADSAERFAVVRADGECWLEDRRNNPNDFPELTESTFARLVCDTARLFPDRPSFVKAVDVTHAAPGYFQEYERVLRAPVKFAAPKNAVRIDEAWLTARAPTANRYAFGVFSAHAQALLDSLEGTRSMRGIIERLLIPILHKGDLTMTAVAGRLGLSPATLYRRLRDEGATYQALLDDLRFKLATHYLDANKVSINEAAYLVGFSDPAAFSRAFKRWTGRSPRARQASNDKTA
jgi:AraC-like DNA-binding protein